VALSGAAHVHWPERSHLHSAASDGLSTSMSRLGTQQWPQPSPRAVVFFLLMVV
jgi:hypothetical protein